MSLLSSEPPSTILIVGNESGIGLALTRRLLSLGHQVIAAGKSQQKLDEAKSICPELITILADVMEESERIKLVKQVRQQHPQVNVLINNSGLEKFPFSIQDESNASAETDWEAQAHEVAENLVAPIHLSTLFLSHFAQKPRAAVLNVTSVLAFSPIAEFPTYSATKGMTNCGTDIPMAHEKYCLFCV